MSVSSVSASTLDAGDFIFHPEERQMCNLLKRVEGIFMDFRCDSLQMVFRNLAPIEESLQECVALFRQKEWNLTQIAAAVEKAESVYYDLIIDPFLFVGR
jgi:hypothetical protein